MKTIYINREYDKCPGEGRIRAGIFYNEKSGMYEWLTYSRSGECKKLTTAYKKIGVAR